MNDEIIAGAAGLAVFVLVTSVRIAIRNYRAIWKYRLLCNSCGKEPYWNKIIRPECCSHCGSEGGSKHFYKEVPSRINPATGKLETKQGDNDV